MTQSVQNPSVSSQNPYITGNNPSTPSIIARMKQVLFGRCSLWNWKDSVLIAGTIFYVMKAAITFFTGSWILAFAELLTAGFFAFIRKEIRDFTNLYKATGILHKENAQFMVSNFNLRKAISTLSSETKKMEQQNAHFAQSNTCYKKQIELTENLLKRASESINTGTDNSKKVLEEAYKTFQKQKKLLDEMQKEATQNGTKALEVWEKIATQVNEMKATGVQTLCDAKEQLEKTSKDAAVLRQEVKDLTTMKESLSQQIKRLQDEVNRLQIVSDRIDTSTTKLVKATGLFHLIFKGDETTTRWVLGLFTITAIGGYVLKTLYQSSI